MADNYLVIFVCSDGGSAAFTCSRNVHALSDKEAIVAAYEELKSETPFLLSEVSEVLVIYEPLAVRSFDPDKIWPESP